MRITVELLEEAAKGLYEITRSTHAGKYSWDDTTDSVRTAWRKEATAYLNNVAPFIDRSGQ